MFLCCDFLKDIRCVSCDVFFCGSLQCFGFFVVDEAEGPDACAKVDLMRLCQVGAAAVLPTKLSLRFSLSSVQLPRRRGLPNRPADNTRWTAKWPLGFHEIPASSRGVQETDVRGNQAVVGCSRKTQLMGSCDVRVLSERFTSSKQRG